MHDRFDLAAFALAGFLAHMLVGAGYGYFRDEFYYLACADHLAWGYVDQPPLSVVLLWLSRHVLGDSVVAIRVLPALAHAGVIALAGWMAAVMGGGRGARGIAMTAALIAPGMLALTGFYSMNAFDLLIWAGAAALLIHIMQTQHTRLWIGLGLVLGLGLQNKISVVWLGFGLACGLILVPERRWLRTRWPWLAAAIAGLLFLPHVIWQIAHGWPTLEFMANASGQKMQTVNPIAFLMGQVRFMHPLTLPLWVGGLVFLMFLPGGRPYRLLGWIYLVVLVLLIANRTSRIGYLAPAYTMLFAAGGVMLESLAARVRARWLLPVYGVLLVAGGAALAPLALPILPVEQYMSYARAIGRAPSTEERKEVGALPQHYADMHGWTALVDTLAVVYEALPEDERAQAGIFVFNYGEAGAIDLLGRPRDLPRATSGHNNYWLWGPRGYAGEVMIFVGGGRDDYTRVYEHVTRAGTTRCEWCMPYETGQAIWICKGLRTPLNEIWPRLKHYD